MPTAPVTAREDQPLLKCWHCNELIGSQSYGVGPNGAIHWACYDKLWPNRIPLVPEAQGEAPQCQHCHLPMSDGNGCHMSVETGAHPSQDARTEFKADTLFGIYCDGWPESVPKDKLVYWEGWQRVADYVNRGARSTPSPDPPQLAQHEPCGKKLANGGNCADILCDLQMGHEGWCSHTFPAVLTNVHEQLETMRLSKDLFKAKFESANIEIERLREALRHAILDCRNQGAFTGVSYSQIADNLEAALAPSLPTKKEGL